MNKVILIGRLGKDPELTFSKNGTAFCKFSLATTERQKEGKTHTEWHNVLVIGSNAENCSKYLRKGSLACAEGKLQTRKWQDKDGKDRYTTEIITGFVNFLDSKKQESSGDDETPMTAQAVDASSFTSSFDDDDIPF